MSESLDQPRHIAVRLRRLREALGFETAREFASFVGINEQSWNHYERGRRPPSFQDAIKISMKTGASLDWVLRGLEHTLPLHLAKKIETVPENWNFEDRRRRNAG